jgi:hypothetical protein
VIVVSVCPVSKAEGHGFRDVEVNEVKEVIPRLARCPQITAWMVGGDNHPPLTITDIDAEVPPGL